MPSPRLELRRQPVDRDIRLDLSLRYEQKFAVFRSHLRR